MTCWFLSMDNDFNLKKMPPWDTHQTAMFIVFQAMHFDMKLKGEGTNSSWAVGHHKIIYFPIKVIIHKL